jgi:hypothetical protein
MQMTLLAGMHMSNLATANSYDRLHKLVFKIREACRINPDRYPEWIEREISEVMSINTSEFSGEVMRPIEYKSFLEILVKAGGDVELFESNLTDESYLRHFKRENRRPPHELLKRAFIWITTPEGQDYWREIADKMRSNK